MNHDRGGRFDRKRQSTRCGSRTMLMRQAAMRKRRSGEEEEEEVQG
jgi:hypothetical protein